MTSYVTAAVTDAHGVHANNVGATAPSHTDSDNRSQRLSQSVTVPNDTLRSEYVYTLPCIQDDSEGAADFCDVSSPSRAAIK